MATDRNGRAVGAHDQHGFPWLNLPEVDERIPGRERSNKQFGRLLVAHLASARDDFERLRAAAQISDWRQVERLAHRTLGGALIVKAQLLIAASRDLEKKASAGVAENINESILRLEALIIHAELESQD